MSLDIQKIAHLAQIKIEPSQVKHFDEELQRIFALIEKMMSVDVQGIPPLFHPLESKQHLRKDEVTENLCASGQFEKLQQLAPETKEGLYLVPQVIE